MLRLILTIGLLLTCGCSGGTLSASRVVAPAGDGPRIDWTDEERAAPVAVRTLKATDSASYHLVLLNDAERPHVHDRSDLTTFVLTGRVRMHFGNRVTDVQAGDVVDIPRGELHWAENLSQQPSEAYVIFAPAFDGKDRRFVATGPASSVLANPSP